MNNTESNDNTKLLIKKPKNTRKRLVEEELTAVSEVLDESDKVILDETKEASPLSDEEKVKTLNNSVSDSQLDETEVKKNLENKADSFKVGPVKSTTATFKFSRHYDYARDLCKDYNETGFCGFGDSCKFLHDRGDYKSGWELDLDWEEEQRKKKKQETEVKEEIKIEKPLEPIKHCGICKKEFTKPIVQTKCGHLFCEKCAIDHARTSKVCQICSTVINGQFKIVKKHPVH